jgi:uncharacterized RDD family membrane protein YckC
LAAIARKTNHNSNKMRKVLGFGIKFLSIAAFILAAFFFKSALLLQDKLGEDALVVYSLAILFSGVGTMGWKTGKKLLIPTLEDKLKKDTRPPVLYLRSFIHDKKASKSPQDGTFIKLMPNVLPQNLLSEEEQIEQVMSNYGPFIAIGKPGEKLPQLGASRKYTSDGEWKTIVSDFINKAQLIILRVGNSDGFWWEVNKVLESAKQNIVFLLPLKFEDYAEFKTKIDRLLPRPLPEAYHPSSQSEQSFGGVLWFDLDGTPYIELSKDRLNKVNYNISNDLSSILAPVFNRLQRKVELIQAPIRLRLYAALSDLFIFGLIVFLFWFGIDQLVNNGIISGDDAIVAVLFPALFYYIYFGLLESTSLFATPGKKIFKLTTRHDSGLPISMFQGLLRAGIKFFELASGLWLISVILLSRNKKAIHDLVLKINVYIIKNNRISKNF